jgi:hypothetical protein
MLKAENVNLESVLFDFFCQERWVALSLFLSGFTVSKQEMELSMQGCWVSWLDLAQSVMWYMYVGIG